MHSARDDILENPILKRYEPVIGLEVHIQLKTKTKLFCGCRLDFGAEPNTNVCEVCLGFPGTLPVINHQAIEYAIAMALAIKGEIAEKSVFARKQYFYPDLPKGYQITQYDLPYCKGGEIVLASGTRVAVTRIHLEEDAGKSIHGSDQSYIDLNRAGTPLLEMVSEPVIQSGSDAQEYLQKVRNLVVFLGISDGNLEEGSIRCDVNISLRPRGEKTLGTRTEIKNVNSYRNVERAIQYEILRQADLLDQGQKVVQQTLKFDAASGKTRALRSKEQMADYRYFAEPDFGPLLITKSRMEAVRGSLPELGDAKAQRFEKDWGLPKEDAQLLTAEPEIALYFEELIKHSGLLPKQTANFFITEFLREAKTHDWQLGKTGILPEALGELLSFQKEGTLSSKMVKDVFAKMVATGQGAMAIIDGEGLRQNSSKQEMARILDEILAQNPKQVEQYLGGKEKVFGFFVGQAMKQSGGTFNPGVLNKILREKLDGWKERDS